LNPSGSRVPGFSERAAHRQGSPESRKRAKTWDDHLRLAAWYQTDARQTQNKLTEEEDLVKYWAQRGMADRAKIPNPYWSAQALVRLYREKLQNATKLAASHQKMAGSLEASVR
jgi:hypothetical protein